MNAIVYQEYGPPDVMQLREVKKPVPKDNEILVRIHAAALNPLDWHLVRGKPFVARFGLGLPKPRSPRLGADLAGQVEAVGGSVTRFVPGDEVFGDTSTSGMGSFAEFAAVPEGALARKPANVSFEQAASVSIAAVTALQGLRDKGGVRQGQKVLINGASGGVGTFAVQIAKSFGAEVTGVCSTRNLELVRSIGADHVVDYTKEDFTRSGEAYDLILDAVGNHSVSDFERTLTAKGKCIVVGFSTLPHMLRTVLRGSLAKFTGGKSIGLLGIAKPNGEDLEFIAELIEAGKVMPVIDRRYPLSSTAEALGYLEEGHARGKVIIQVDSAVEYQGA